MPYRKFSDARLNFNYGLRLAESTTVFRWIVTVLAYVRVRGTAVNPVKMNEYVAAVSKSRSQSI